MYLILFHQSIDICTNSEVDTDVSSFKSNSLRNACHPERSSEVCDDADDPDDYYNDLIGQLSSYY